MLTATYIGVPLTTSGHPAILQKSLSLSISVSSLLNHSDNRISFVDNIKQTIASLGHDQSLPLEFHGAELRFVYLREWDQEPVTSNGFTLQKINCTIGPDE